MKNQENLYQSTIEAKDGSAVPVLKSGKPMHSKYNPFQEADRLVDNLSGESFLFMGIGGAFQILSCRKKYPDAKILCCELNEASLEFCKALPQSKTLISDKNLIFCTTGNLKETLLTSYLPAIHGNLAISFNRSWEEENKIETEEIRKNIIETLKIISADFSVQSHFGKLWQHNIFCNLNKLSKSKSLVLPKETLLKTAAVIAAGPSLDETVVVLKENRDSFFIISTDTSYGTLLKNNIKPDAVVSVDAQQVSSTHFYGADFSGTHLFFDLSSPCTSVNSAIKKNASFTFVQNSHPLASYISEKTFIQKTNSGSGTVTITACDIANLLGFKSIKLFGADFCYNSGKPYARGTYLDTNFSLLQGRLTPQETLFSSLMFRTELQKAEKNSFLSPNLKNPMVSQVLESYKQGLFEWALKNDFEFKGNLLVKNCSQKENEERENIKSKSTEMRNFSYKTFTQDFLTKLKSAIEEKKLTEEMLCIAPYVAWLRKNRKSEKSQDFFELSKLAYSSILRYNEEYEK